MKTSGQGLDEYLHEQRGRGVIDSSGEFTVNADKALEKLASSRFTEIAFWTLKFVQFAAVNRALEMKVVVEQRVTRVTVLLPLEEFQFDELVSELRQHEASRDSKYHHLVVALRCLVGSGDHRFALHFGQACLLWDQEFFGAADLTKEVVTPGLTLEVTAEISGLAPGLARRAREIHLLTTRALTAPFPIFLDGRQIDFSNLEPSKHYSQTLDLDFIGDPEGCRLPTALSSLSSHLDGSARRSFEARAKAQTKVRSFWFVNYNYEVHHRPFSFSPFPMSRPRPSYVFWVKDGVILEKQILDKRLPFSAQIFLCADRCSTDLSECKLQVNRDYAELASGLPSLLGQITDDMDERLSKIDRLGQGRVLGGWDVVTGTAQHMLKGLAMGRWIADKGGRYCSLPHFRKKLLAHLKVQRVNFRVLSLQDLSSTSEG